LKGFKALAYPPIHQNWNGKTVYTTAAPSSGAMLLAMLNIVEGFDFPSTPKSEGGCNSPQNIHRFLEAMKFAFGARSEVTDPAYATSEQKDRYLEFTTKKWAKEARHKITVSFSYCALMDE
jgi:gamma-glutamyltranspeptidase/glutathione hydrolase/leukotriene-C4 hydrolase